MIKNYLEKVIAKENLTIKEAAEVMLLIMNGEVNNSQLAGFLTGLKSKGETAEEIAGFANTMREKSIKINTDKENTIDVCGTGGDNSHTFNISTAAAFVVAGAGIRVAKHGNRSVSSLSGSADVLKTLGVNIDLSPEKTEKALNEIGIAFLFAPLYHPAMKFAATVRKELGVRTVFNILGPLTNPAGVKKQLVGTFNKEISGKMAEASKFLNYSKVCYITSDNNVDEITLNGNTYVYEYEDSKGVKKYEINNNQFGYPEINPLSIAGKSAEDNAKIMLKVFNNETNNGAFHVVASNAAMGLYASGYSDDLRECLAAAEESIRSGKALKKLNALKEIN